MSGIEKTGRRRPENCRLSGVRGATPGATVRVPDGIGLVRVHRATGDERDRLGAASDQYRHGVETSPPSGQVLAAVVEQVTGDRFDQVLQDATIV